MIPKRFLVTVFYDPTEDHEPTSANIDEMLQTGFSVFHDIRIVVRPMDIPVKVVSRGDCFA